MIRSLFLSLIVFTATTGAQAQSPLFDTKCWQDYLKDAATNKSVAATVQYVRNAADDYDWESINAMVVRVRTSLRLGKWSNEAFQDLLNYEVVTALMETIDTTSPEKTPICQGKPWTIQRLNAWTIQAVVERIRKDESLTKLLGLKPGDI